MAKKKFKQILWGFKYPDGTILTGHDNKVITNRTREETLRQCNTAPNSDIHKPRPVRLIIEEK
jgi:hypothetical protein